ncbi:hypothetical protein D3C76_1777770 [compost metagenome]
MRISRSCDQILAQLGRQLDRGQSPLAAGRHLHHKIQHREHHIRHNDISQSSAVECTQHPAGERPVDIIVEEHEPA